MNATPQRLRSIRAKLGLTQARLAEYLGVTNVTISRWENGAVEPSPLAMEKIELAERHGLDGLTLDRAQLANVVSATQVDEVPTLDFAGDPEDVRLVVEAERLSYGHLANPAFATECSLIDPLPHQRIAVYQHMLDQPRLRFLLADDAGAGKTIMAGLYIREMVARRLIRRILIVPPAGLIGNWRRELRKLFNLNFRIVQGADARSSNPFTGRDGDQVIISMDTLAVERVFARLQDSSVEPYDLVIFDEAHKLSARRDPDGTFRPTDRYKLGEALAGVHGLESRWRLKWAPNHLLLLTATPHMGKDFPYYSLWRLLEPQVLSTEAAFDAFPAEERCRRFIRRMKEEMVYFDGRPIYPQRISDTLTYDLTQGEISEQALYDGTTRYIEHYYNQARILNRSAARFAIGVFQRRLASSTWALLCSLRNRLAKIDRLIEALRAGELSEEELQRRQSQLDRSARDDLNELTGDEEETDDGREGHEKTEDELLGGFIATSLAQLIVEREQVDQLIALAERVHGEGQESKFEKLGEVLRDPKFANEKVIIFTEHRDTQDFLVRRFEGRGLTGRIALINGGMGFKKRDVQVELFKKSVVDGGAQYLICTDAAGEGINLQFAWLMVNYDIPWNPARLEQRMGRIHRYGQQHDPVVIVNLVAGKTREGRVMHVILEKLERIRKELGSDKVFDVIGRLFEGVSLRDYMERVVQDEQHAVGALGELEGRLTPEQVEALEAIQRRIYGQGGDVRSQLEAMRAGMSDEETRRLLPGHVMRFIEKAAPRVGLRIEGDLREEFMLAPRRAGALDPLLAALETYDPAQRERFTAFRPQRDRNVLFLHPGEPVFDGLRDLVRRRFQTAAQRGGVFVDAAAREPYLFHLAEVSIVRRAAKDVPGLGHDEILEQRLVGVRQSAAGECALDAIEQLLLLRPGDGGLPGSGAALAAFAAQHIESAEAFVREEVAEPLAAQRRSRAVGLAHEKQTFLSRGFDYQEAELAAARADYSSKARAGDARSKAELERIRDRQREIGSQRQLAFDALGRESDLIAVGDIQFIAHALIVPSIRPADRKHRDDAIEAIAVQRAAAHELARGATPEDVSTPAAAREIGLADFPGFDLRSRHPSGEERYIEVKGRARVGEVELSENEWAKAATHGEKYWLYVVFDCGTPQPKLYRVQNPFRTLLFQAKGGVLIEEDQILQFAASHE